MSKTVKPDFAAPDLKPEQTKALTAQAFVLEVNTVLAALQGFAKEQKIAQPIACAAMLIFCRNCVPEGHATRHALDTVLRKNFPFIKLEVPPQVPQ